jgi:hypothetical protein
VYEAFEIANHHFYLGRWKLFFGNTVYGLLFSFGHLLFLLFHHPSTSCLFFFPTFHQKWLFFYCFLTPTLIISFVSSPRRCWVLFIFAFTTTQNGAASEERKRMYLLPETQKERMLKV